VCRAASRRGTKPISRRAISARAAAAAVVAAAVALAPPPARAAEPPPAVVRELPLDDPRVTARSTGGDFVTARHVAARLLARPLPAQLLRVRCERAGPHADCGLSVSGVKFHRAMDLAAWNAEIADLIDGAFAVAPDADEVDCWAVVPLDAGKGTVVSGDYAKPTAATVFSITVPRAARRDVRAKLARGTGVFWDPAFRASLSKGTAG
jgi:hypothetical protein